MSSNQLRILKLGEFAKVKGGKRMPAGTALVAYGTDHPYLRIVDFKDGSIDRSNLQYVPNEVFPAISRYVISSKDLYISIVGTIGLVGSVPPDLSGANLTENAAKICEIDSSVIHRDYLGYFLRSDVGQAEIRSLAVGSTQPKLALFRIEQIAVPCPPLDVQLGISSLLGALDDRITLLRETNATLEAIAQALFKSWFVDFDPVRAKAEGRQPEGMDATTAALFPDSFEESELGLVPKGWTVVRLGDVTERITKGTTPTTLKRSFVESGINFVKVESITDDGQLLPGKFAYIDDETHCLLGRSQLKADDVLITIAGTIGRVAVITEDFIPANTNQAVAIVRPYTSKLPSAFVNQFLRLADSKSRMGERVVQAVQANLSLGSLSDMKLVMPPSELVTKLHDLVFDSVGSKRNTNQQCIRTLTQLRDTLLPRLISGQLRLPEAMAQISESTAQELQYAN
jgi:type I restriction enzyme S subunit